MRESYLVPAEQLRSFGEGVLQKAGVPREDAKINMLVSLFWLHVEVDLTIS